MKNLKRTLQNKIFGIVKIRSISIAKHFGKLVMSCLCSCIAITALGQAKYDTLSNYNDTISKKIKFSPRFGLTYSNHKEKSEHSFEGKRKPILGFMVGVATNKPITDNLVIESGFFLAQKGSKSDSDGFSDEEEYYEYSDILRMLYIDVPLLVRYTLFKTDESGLAFYGGLQPSFLLNAKRTNKTANTEEKETVTKLFKKFDATAIIGAGYLFENGLVINASYDHGLVNINKRSEPNGDNYFKTYNRVFKISIAYQLGKKDEYTNR